ncbi:hypothetical protein INT45_013355 [Circinella minor]|uniref:Retrotransposon gag domain-containing protein n=1 Tax=Circinella minor TaxID=1195481 RepID=A0A8H7VEB1_9FUNG|nr:hypothetical protein INT45_013355 [Circinella minor]
MSDTIHSKIFKFISAPGTFSGTKRGKNPTVWLGEIKHLWQRGNFTNDKVLLIAGSNLKGQAGLWWTSLEDSILTWDAFEEAFHARFISAEHREAWWSEIEAIKQQDNKSVESVAYKLQELFDLVGPVDEIFQICYFTQVIDPNIAYRMEETGVSTSWKQAVNKAICIQNAQRKYLNGQELTQNQGVKNQIGASVGIPQSAVSLAIKPEDSVSQTNMLLSQVAESLKALQLQTNSPATPCWTRSLQEGGIKERYLGYVVPLVLRLALCGVLSRPIWIGLAPFRIRSVLKRIGFSEIRIVHGLENCNPNPFRKNPD